MVTVLVLTRDLPVKQPPLYRPVRFYPPDRLDLTVEDLALMSLADEGLVEYDFTWNRYDAIFGEGHSAQSVANAIKLAARGVIVIVGTSKEKLSQFQGIENIFPYTGDITSAGEIELFLRNVLFRVRDRFYIGPTRK